MYFIFLKRKVTWSNWFIWVGKYIINLFTWSKYHHAASTFYKDGKMYVGEAKMSGARIIELSKFKKEEGSHNKIYAYKVLPIISPTKLIEFNEKMVGSEFDFKGAARAAIKIIDEDDGKVFCSEREVILCQELNLLPKDIDASTINPKEFLKLLKKNAVIDFKPEIWR